MCVDPAARFARELIAMPDTHALLDLEHFLPYRLSVLSNRISQTIAETYVERFGIAIPEWRVIAVLGRHPGLSANGVAVRTAIVPSSCTARSSTVAEPATTPPLADLPFQTNENAPVELSVQFFSTRVPTTTLRVARMRPGVAAATEPESVTVSTNPSATG